MTITCLTNELANAGQPLMCDDIITYLFVGFGSEYDSLVSMVIYHDTSLTLEEVYSMLLTCETRIQHNNQPLSLPTTFTNIITRPFSGWQGRNYSIAPKGRVHGQFSDNHDGGHGNIIICCVNFVRNLVIQPPIVGNILIPFFKLYYRFQIFKQTLSSINLNNN